MGLPWGAPAISPRKAGQWRLLSSAPEIKQLV